PSQRDAAARAQQRNAVERCGALKKWKRMGSGDPSGLQNRREASLMSPVRSTRTRFRHFLWGSFDSPSLPLSVAQDFGARLMRGPRMARMKTHCLSRVLLPGCILLASVFAFAAQPLPVSFHTYPTSQAFRAPGSVFEGATLTRTGDALTYGSSAGTVNYTDPF